jgi:hypothetical protein
MDAELSPTTGSTVPQAFGSFQEERSRRGQLAQKPKSKKINWRRLAAAQSGRGRHASQELWWKKDFPPAWIEAGGSHTKQKTRKRIT